jgi:hypothetical protein
MTDEEKDRQIEYLKAENTRLRAAVEEEREVCAKILELEAERHGSGFPNSVQRTVAELLLTLAIKIRARGNKDR